MLVSCPVFPADDGGRFSLSLVYFLFGLTGILEQILARQLFSATNLRKLMKSHREEALELLHFISVNQELPLAFDPRHPAKNYSPTPTHNIESSAGMLSCYIGE